MSYFSNNSIFWFVMLSLLLLYSSIRICEMSFILALDVIASWMYISSLSSMFNSLRNSRISPISASFGVEIESFNIVLIMVNCISVSSLISSLLMYQVSHPYQSTGSIVVWYTFISIRVFICESTSFLVVQIQTRSIDWIFAFFSFKCWFIFRSFVALSPRYFISVLNEYALLLTIIFELSVLQLLLLNISTPLF